MQIPETPKKVSDLDLMKRLENYGRGEARWSPQAEVGAQAQEACKALHAQVTAIVEKALAPILDRITAKEMDTFTMHDRSHGLKVAHLMWQILDDSRRETLTPPEIALLVIAAHFHDIGMALTKEERAERLNPSSDLWERLEVDERTKERIEKLREDCKTTNSAIARSAHLQLTQIEESLLSQDTRERHATQGRYEQVLATLREFHARDPEGIPGIDESLSFDGNSFRDKLIDICVSHNEDAEAIVRRDPQNPARPRFPTSFPIGASVADLHMVAAALRLADILDFDRERTPPALFYYLIPIDLPADENRSVLEWGKHMSISHWHIDEDAVIFRGRCKDHIIHHAVVLFCASIQQEIQATLATFGALKTQASWPFSLPSLVKSEIHEEGYHYVPYRFELDDERIYSLLMGGAIYEEPLVAVRELVQNAVDACKLRDALTQLSEPYTPTTDNRIFVSYEEPSHTHHLPLLTISDTGTGMDAFILERYFLRVGQSYYNSQEFKRDRIELRKSDLDFAPISEFGIGFLSCFLLADRVEVETAMWESPRGDTRKRTLLIDGPTRLIRLNEEPNEGSRRFKGTHIRLYLRQTAAENSSIPQWNQIQEYLRKVCRELPYRINLRYNSAASKLEDHIDPSPLRVDVPHYLEPAILRIPVKDEEIGLEGEIALTNIPMAEELEQKLSHDSPVALETASETKRRRMRGRYYAGTESELLRGGFSIGEVPGLPRMHIDHIVARAKIRLAWLSNKQGRYLRPNLARTGIANERVLALHIVRAWLSHLIENSDKLAEGQLEYVDWGWLNWQEAGWLEKYSAYDIYRLIRKQWIFKLKQRTSRESALEEWESGKLDVIQFGDHYDITRHLKALILPRICGLILGPGGNKFLSRPLERWVQILKDDREFIRKPAQWGPYTTYAKGINHLLFYAYPGYDFFNLKFKDRLDPMKDDLNDLADLLYEIVRARDDKRIARLSQTNIDLLNKAITLAGDLHVGSARGEWWPLQDFAPAMTQPVRVVPTEKPIRQKKSRRERQ